MTCLNCKYWEMQEDYITDDAFVNKRVSTEYGVCKLAVLVNYWEQVDSATMKIPKGGFGGENIFTHELFGCNKYEYKFE